MNLTGEMFKRDIEEVIREENQRVYSTPKEEEEDIDGSSLKTMRKELKKDLDYIRGDENGWKTFISERNMMIDQEKGVPPIVPVSSKPARMTGEVKLGSITCVKDALRGKTL